MRSACVAAVLLLAGLAGAPGAPEPLVYKLRGTPDAAATGGEAKTLDKEGIYVWWDGIAVPPGAFEVWARARALKQSSVLHFVLCDSRPSGATLHAVSKTKRGKVEAGAYQDVYCGAFLFDGSFPPRLSDWSSGGLMVDWVKVVPVAQKDIRDPDPALLKEVAAPRFAAPPAIDGDLKEWDRVPGLRLGAAEARSSDYGGTSDLSGLCRWAWDDRALYFAALVQDNDFRFLADAAQLANLWQSDSIQIAFDGAHNARGAGYDGDDYEYGLGLVGGKGRAYRWQTGNNLPLGDVPNIEVAVRPDPEHRVLYYEIAIPWTELVPFSPRQPHCGMTLTINDNDGGRAMRAWLEWTPGIASAKNPAAFGTLRLVNAPPAAQDVLLWIAGERDLSDRDEATFHAQAQAPSALGRARMEWTLAGPGGEVAKGVEDLNMQAGTHAVPITLKLAGLASGKYRVRAALRRGDRTVAEAEETFARYNARGLQERLASLASRQDALWARLTESQRAGRKLHYPQATLATVAEFATFTGADLKARRYERAEEVLAELESLLKEADAEMERLAAHPELDFAVPELAKERLKVRDGGFWSGGRPVFLLGFCGWWDVWSGTRRLARLGINHSQDSIVAPFALFPEDGEQVHKAMLDGLDWGFLYGDESGCAYSRMIACNQLPPKFGERHPNAKAEGGWGGFCTLHPELRAFEERYLKAVAQAGKRHWATAAYILWGENGHALSAHPLEQAAFRAALSRRYGTVQRLNAAWGTRFAGFEDRGVSGKVDSPVAWYDRGIFNYGTFTRWTEWLARQVRREDPDALVTAYPSLLSWDDSSDFSNGVDVEALCRVLDVNGCDTAALEYGDRRWAMASITGFAMVQDLLQTFNPKHPNHDPELHLVNSGKRYPPEYVRAALFQGFLHGLSAANLWVYQRSEGIDSMLTFQPRVMEAYARTALDLRRLVEPVRAFQRAPAQVAILHSLASVAYHPRHLEEMRSAYEGLFFLDAKVGFVTERTVAEGALRGVKVLVLPQASHVPAGVARRIAAWVRAGGTLLAVGGCLKLDQANRSLGIALPAGIAAKVAGVAVSKAAYGRGSVLRLAAPAALESYARLGDAVFGQAWVARRVRVAAKLGPLHGVEMRAARAPDGGRLVYLVNMAKTQVEAALKPAPGPMRDLITGSQVTFPVRLQPLQVLLLRAEGRPH